MNRKSNNNFLKNTLQLILGSMAAQAINLLTIPIVTRLYSPDSYGVLTLFLSVCMLITEISCLRLQTAVLLPPKNKDAYNVFILCVFFVFIFSFSVFFISLVLKTTSFHLPESYKSLRPYFNLMAVYVFLAGTYKALIFINVRKNQFSIQALSRFSDVGGSKLFSICYGLFLVDNPVGLIGGLIFGNIISCWLLLKNLFKEFLYYLSSVDIRSLIGIFKRYNSFAIYSVTALMEAFSREIAPLLLGIYFSPIIVGFVGLTKRVVQQPLGVFGEAISRSFFQKIAEKHRNNERYDIYVFDLFKMNLIISFIPVLLLSAIAPDIFNSFFGPEWRTAGLYLSMLSLSYYSGFLYRPFSIIFDVMEKQRLRFILNFLRFTLNIAAICCGAYIFNSPVYAILFYSAVNTTITFGTMFYLMKLSGVSLSSIFSVIGNQILIGTLLLFFVLYIKFYSFNLSPLSLLAIVGLIIVGYLIFLLIRDPELKKRIIFITKNVKSKYV